MSFSAEIKSLADGTASTATALIEVIKGPACLLSGDGNTVLAVNRKAHCHLNPIAGLHPFSGTSFGQEEGSGMCREQVFPLSPQSLSVLSDNLGKPMRWSLTLEGTEYVVLAYSVGDAADRDPEPEFPLGGEGHPERGAVHDRSGKRGWTRKNFGQLFQKSPVPFLYAENLQVRRANPAFCDLLGFREKELIGLDLSGVFDTPGQRGECLPPFLEELNDRDSLLREARLRDREGGILEAMVFAIPFRHKEGKRAHFFFVQEVSRRKELERLMLRNSMVVTKSPLVVFQGELGDRFTLSYISENVSRFGYSAEEMVSGEISFYSLIHPDDLGRVPKRAAPEGSERGDREYLFRMRDPRGEYHWMNLWDRILPGSGGEPDTVVGVILDVTERREAEIALQASHGTMEEHLRRLELAWEQTIGLLAGVTELRDPYTMGHQRRVAHLAGALAREMGLGEGMEQEVVRAGLIHDIGKIQIPAEYLSKPGKLAEKEFAIIREHPTTGGDLLKGIELPWPLANIVLQHHERMDGSGYPHGLRGEDILPAARIIAVADVVEAMASHRPYRPALGIGKALEEITKNSGRLYDPEVVAACRSLFFKRDYSLPVA